MTSQPNACQSNRQKSHFHLSSSALQPGTQQLFPELICISLVSQAEAAKARAPRIKELPPPLLAWPVRGGRSLFSELRLWSSLSVGHQRATVVHTSDIPVAKWGWEAGCRNCLGDLGKMIGTSAPSELLKTFKGGMYSNLREQSSLTMAPEVQKHLIWQNTRELGSDPSSDAHRLCSPPALAASSVKWG